MHRVWKQRLISALDLRSGDRVLDLACGSGDLAWRASRTQPDARIVGGDFTFAMLRVARARESSFHARPGWINLDALAMPFPDGVFDVVMMAYGLRNMADPFRALREIARVLKTGGAVAILDFGKPSHPAVRMFYHVSLKTIQPALGWLFFGDARTYRYIYDSLAGYPAQEGVTRLLMESGFQEAQCVNLACGTMSLHIAVRKE